jgi:hypothetical protein
MKGFYVDKKAKDGLNEIHSEACYYVLVMADKEFLGSFNTPSAAMQEAKKRKYHPAGCKSCCPESSKK